MLFLAFVRVISVYLKVQENFMLFLKDSLFCPQGAAPLGLCLLAGLSLVHEASQKG